MVHPLPIEVDDQNSRDKRHLTPAITESNPKEREDLLVKSLHLITGFQQHPLSLAGGSNRFLLGLDQPIAIRKFAQPELRFETNRPSLLTEREVA